MLAHAAHEDFIEAAYNELLGRMPDDDGFLHYRFLLRAGFPRISVLQSLANSDEARRRRVVLENIPPMERPGPIRRFTLAAGLRVRGLFWRIFLRRAEAAERRYVSSGARFWELARAGLSSQLRWHQDLETAIHAWRRDIAGQFGRLRERLDALETERRTPSGPAVALGERGRFEINGMRFVLTQQESESLAREALARFVPPGIDALLNRVLAPGMVVWDTAAGLGVFSIVAARRVAPGGKVHSLQTDLHLYPVLLENLAANGLLHDGTAMARLICQGPEAALSALRDGLEGQPRVELLRIGAGNGRDFIEGILTLAAVSRPGLVLWELPEQEGQAPPVRLLERTVEAGFRISRVCPDTGDVSPVTPGSAAGACYLIFERIEPDRNPEASRT